MGMVWRVFKHLAGTRKLLLPNVIPGRERSEGTRNLEVVSTRFRILAGARPGMTQGGFLKIDPLAAVGGEQMQLFPRRHRPDPLADGGRDCARDTDDHLAWRQLPGIGGNALHLVLTGAVKEGFGPDALDRFHREVEGNAARDRVARNHKII